MNKDFDFVSKMPTNHTKLQQKNGYKELFPRVPGSLSSASFRCTVFLIPNKYYSNSRTEPTWAKKYFDSTLNCSVFPTNNGKIAAILSHVSVDKVEIFFTDILLFV